MSAADVRGRLLQVKLLAIGVDGVLNNRFLIGVYHTDVT
jgi:hypothetical protein